MLKYFELFNVFSLVLIQIYVHKQITMESHASDSTQKRAGQDVDREIPSSKRGKGILNGCKDPAWSWNFDTLSSTGRFFKSIHLFVYRENTPGSNGLGEVHIVQKEHVNMEVRRLCLLGSER